MALHQDQVPVDEATIRSLLAAQCRQWAALPLSPAGAGTDNTTYRLGDDLLVRVPRTPDRAASSRVSLRAAPTYWDALSLDDVTWTRARAWAIGVAVSGISYYWHTYPPFVAECRGRLR
ncbi:hypothetical protein [Micromonospora sp. KC721]|uniref:hypothetical protein n=1 Tax=Micromonospora sp. KC721 TaxID=2530380 RepID=UPI001047A4B7|nr:hypothetical protein [Micromonospora sp. KC721]TDB73200.1 hypothetical protein E1182_21560 [Micromonospora sp. KC721]